MIQSLLRSRPGILLVLIVSATITGFSQSDSNLERLFKDNIGLSQAEINSIRSGRAIATALPSQIPAEICAVRRCVHSRASQSSCIASA